ncbi:MAG TPA: hypothetical protein VMK53_09195 [Gemmatimonadales bacterium]|nr:hypothetical protein [Gemmatimonadales bacterium]
MWFKNRGWIPVAWLASAVNLGAVWFAAAPGEPMHATLHAALAVGFGLGARHLRTRHRALLQDQQLQEALDQNAYLEETAETMQTRVRELEERVDFAERLLANQRSEGESVR